MMKAGCFTRPVLLSMFLLSLILLPVMSAATDVGGIIYTDTTWDLAGSPYNMIANVETDNGVTLTIEPGVVVNGGNGFRILVRGNLNATGTQISNIVFNDAELVASSALAAINIQFSVIDGGQLVLASGNSTFSIRNSKIRDVWDISIADSSNPNDSFIERNVFFNVSAIRVGKSAGYVQIRNNVFYQQTGPLMIDGEIGQPAHAVIEYNSFLSTDRIALQADQNAMVTAINNYWNTTDTAVIDSMPVAA